jgi:hypothetical protein
MTDRPTLLADPFACPGAYTLDAYCRYEFSGHGFREFPHQFITETAGQAKAQAKRRGWIFHRDGTATCPKCAQAVKGKDPR